MYPAILLGTYAAQRIRTPWPSNDDARITSPHFFAVERNIMRRSRIGVATTGCRALDRVRGDRDAAQECRGDSYARALAATLNCRAGRLDRPSGFGRMPAGYVDCKTQLASEAINAATSLKQAVFGHLREF
jgi:hypothetical protein